RTRELPPSGSPERDQAERQRIHDLDDHEVQAGVPATRTWRSRSPQGAEAAGVEIALQWRLLPPARGGGPGYGGHGHAAFRRSLSAVGTCRETQRGKIPAFRCFFGVA